MQEWGILLNPANPFAWIDAVKNHSLIGLPYHGLTLTPSDTVMKKIKNSKI